jgi:hypothetical protein
VFKSGRILGFVREDYVEAMIFAVMETGCEMVNERIVISSRCRKWVSRCSIIYTCREGKHIMVEELKLGTLCSGMKSCELCFGGKEPTIEFLSICFVITFRAISSNLFFSIIDSK